MAIQDDFTIDYVNRRVTYTTAFVDDRPPNIYTVNALYSWLQDTFDEPAQMDDLIPMTAQTPTQYTLVNQWFMSPHSMKALYGGSIQTGDWTKSGSAGITALRWQDTPTIAPDSGDIGEVFTGGTSTATGIMLDLDTDRQVVWVRNTSAAQFQDNEAVTGPATDPNFNTMATRGFATGENIWTNIFSTGPIRDFTEAYIGQEDDYLGGTAFHDADADSRYERRMEKIDEWWDYDVDFSGSPNDVGAEGGHIDLLVLTQELGNTIDGQRLAVFARQHGQVYSHFEILGGAKNAVIAFAANAADLNAADGPYNIGYDAKAGGNFAIGDVLENDTGTTPVGRLRAVITGGGDLVSAAGDIDFYLLGDTEPLATTDRTLIQFANNDNIKVRGGAVTADIDTVGTALTSINGGIADGITFTFADAQADVDEDTTNEEYACTINCNNKPLAQVYERAMFLCSRGNQNGTTTDTQDTLLPSGHASKSEASEFYRAVGDIVFTYNAGQGTQPTEGDLVTNGTGAYGVVTSITAGTTGTCVLTQVKGTFANTDVVAEIDAAASNDITINSVPETIADNTAAPFGTFAGGRWFLARGVLLTNVPAADSNNWETVDLAGVRRAPPAQRAITLGGMAVNDRGAIFEVTAAGGTTLVKNHESVGAAGAALSAVVIPMNTSVDNDVPTDGWCRVVDASATDGTEYRYEYSSISGTDINLRTGAGLTGTTTSAGTATLLNDTGAFASYGTDGNVKTGMEIYNVPDGSRAVVLRKVSDDQIETTPLTGGTSNDWANAEAWEANQVVVALVDADDIYFPFIDDEVRSGTSLSTTIKYVADTECIARMRFSDPDVGGQRQLPFELKNVQITDADLTVTVQRNDDLIAS
jgi:hypothetical protein